MLEHRSRRLLLVVSDTSHQYVLYLLCLYIFVLQGNEDNVTVTSFGNESASMQNNANSIETYHNFSGMFFTLTFLCNRSHSGIDTK